MKAHGHRWRVVSGSAARRVPCWLFLGHSPAVMLHPILGDQVAA